MDEYDFREEELKRLEIYDDNCYFNDNLNSCIDKIKNRILSDIKKDEKTRKIGCIQ